MRPGQLVLFGAIVAVTIITWQLATYQCHLTFGHYLSIKDGMTEAALKIGTS